MPLRFAQVENHTLCTSFLGPTSTVLDLGCNKGAFIRSMRQTYGCRCFAVEPNPGLFERLSLMSDIQAFNYAVAGSEGEVDFSLAANDEASSIVRSDSGGVGNRVKVKTIGLAGLLRQMGVEYVDLLKVDIEGAEIEMFDAMPDSIAPAFGQLTVEFHDFCGVPISAIERVSKKLAKLGYVGIKFSRHTYGNVWFVNTRRLKVSRLDLAYAKYIYRNLAGAGRILSRALPAHS
jgi:FkbM family methyltransferase